MLTGPIEATRKALARAGMKVGDIDVFEVNEAFAPVLLAWSEDTGACSSGPTRTAGRSRSATRSVPPAPS